MNFNRATYSKAAGTSLQGYVDVSYDKLVDIFGSPTACVSVKTDAEWVLQFEDGTIATIYNYKDGKNYNGEEGLELSEITDWHIGGNSRAALDRVKEVIEPKPQINMEIKEPTLTIDAQKFRKFLVAKQHTMYDIAASMENADGSIPKSKVIDYTIAATEARVYLTIIEAIDQCKVTK